MAKHVDFFSRVNKNGPNGCWLWEGPMHREGYGVHCEKHKTFKAHRWSYELHKGPIPEGLEIDHLCHVRNCVNPDHLEAVTTRENMLRSLSPTGINARKTHCSKGHPYDLENTIITREGWRKCRICKKVNDPIKIKRHRERKRLNRAS